MISSRSQILLIAFFLCMLGLSITMYKVLYLNVPLTPHEKLSLFTVTASIEISKSKNPIVISLILPKGQDGMKIVSSETDSGNFGYTISKEDGVKYATLAKRVIEENTKIFHKITILADPFYTDIPEAAPSVSEKSMEDPIELWGESEQIAAKTLLDYVHSHSADDATFTAELIARFNSKHPVETVSTLLKMKEESKLSLIITLLRHKDIAVRKIKGIELKDRQKNRKLITMLEVKSDGKWHLYSLEDGKVTKPDNFFIWHKGNEALLTTKGDVKVKLRFSVVERKVAASSIAKEMIQEANAEFINFSLYTLPGLQQNTFKQLLLIPIGALIVVIMRIIVGIRTMGTFMPILFSLAFIQTTLMSGIMMFIVIISAGLFIRAYLTRLQLLLVARISAVIIVVIAIMSIMSIVSYRLGIDEVLQITFFPMIILSWTIERMSILWEEAGGEEVLIQGSGSLIVAIFAYYAMDNTMVRYLTFNFPELLLIILSVIILIGRYTGYRLSELIRFSPLGK